MGEIHGKLSGGKLLSVIALAVLLIIVGGILVFNSDKNQNNPYPDNGKDIEIIKGNPDSDIVLTEYADFQCPACAIYYQVVKEIDREFGQDIKFVYRFLPLRSIHRNAQISAQAGFAAYRQGKFWEMHDMLYAKQKEWEDVSNPESIFIGYAQEIGLNIDTFKRDMKSEDTKNKVDSDLDKASALGLNSTPTFFLNDQQIRPGSFDEFRTLIQAAIDQKKTSANQ